MKLLQDYFKLQKEIYEYFGYEEQWEAYPLEDNTECYWYLNDEQVIYYKAESEEEAIKAFEEDDGKYCEADLYTEKPIYPGKDYTMICVDTRTDGNDFLMIFDNAKKIDRSRVRTFY